MHLDLIQFSGPAVEKRAQELNGGKIIVAIQHGRVQPANSLVKPAAAQGPIYNLPAYSKKEALDCRVLAKKDSSALQALRGKCDLIAVLGSSPEMCAWAANSKGVDLLLQPFSAEKCFLDVETANVLRDSDVFVCIFFNEFLEAEGFRLSQLLKNAAMCVKLCEKAGAKLFFASGARNEMQFRAAKDFSSFGVMLGMKKEAALKTVRESPENFLGRLKKQIPEP